MWLLHVAIAAVVGPFIIAELDRRICIYQNNKAAQHLAAEDRRR
jgi:hypothetical protein